MQILLDWGTDVNINNEEIGTALHVAVSLEHEKIVHLLLDRGADIDAHSEGLHSALQAAAAERHEKAVQIYWIEVPISTFRVDTSAVCLKRHHPTGMRP
jgi:ankyrin repeat protein